MTKAKIECETTNDLSPVAPTSNMLNRVRGMCAKSGSMHFKFFFFRRTSRTVKTEEEE